MHRGRDGEKDAFRDSKPCRRRNPRQEFLLRDRGSPHFQGASIDGTTDDYFTAGSWHLSSGRTFTETEERAGKAVCIVGETVRRTLFGTQNPVGGEIRVKNFSCEIVGLLTSKGQASMGRDQDDTVVMPFETFQRRLAGTQDVGTVMVSVSEGRSTESAQKQIESLLRERRHIPGDE